MMNEEWTRDAFTHLSQEQTTLYCLPFPYEKNKVFQHASGKTAMKW